jgi:nickel/cobalt transporter (NicO) family protein
VIRVLLLAAALLFGVLYAPSAVRADPFTGGPPISAPVQTGTAFLMPGGMLRRLAHMQMQLNEKISQEFRSIHSTGSVAATFTVLLLAFVYGVVHAAGPGHGKTVVGSYFVANDARWFTGLFLGGLIALLQGVTAIVLVFLISLVLRARELQVADQGALVDCVSYGIVAAIGCVMLWRAITDNGDSHSHGLVGHDHGHRHDAIDRPPAGMGGRLRRGLIAATGVAPCASAIIIMLFALANDAMGIGIAAVLALSLGMAVTVAGVGLISVVVRKMLMHAMEGPGLRFARAERILRLLGSAAIVGFAGLLMLGALARL